MPRTKENLSIKMILLGLWLLFTSSMVAWWWIYGINLLTEPTQSLEQHERRARMIMWEGSFFLLAIFVGGAALWVYMRRDQKRHDQMRVFFSTFSHDMKTSISRLRLQSEVLKENLDLKSPQLSNQLNRLVNDINRLDLQLENSLLLSRSEEEGFFNEELKLSELIAVVKPEWDELEVHLDREAVILGDRRALLSVFRNLFQNSVLHGKARGLSVAVAETSSGRLTLSIADDGLGYSGDHQSLGVEFLKSHEGSGNGIGLYLSRQLVRRIGGELSFPKSEQGFVSLIEIRGRRP